MADIHNVSRKEAGEKTLDMIPISFVCVSFLQSRSVIVLRYKNKIITFK